MLLLFGSSYTFLLQLHQPRQLQQWQQLVRNAPLQSCHSIRQLNPAARVWDSIMLNPPCLHPTALLRTMLLWQPQHVLQRAALIIWLLRNPNN